MSSLVFDVYAADDPNGSPLCTLTEAFDKSIRVELSGTGSGKFTISRHSGQAAAFVLKQDNLVKVTLPDVDADPIFSFFLEVGDFALISSDEEGGENLTFGGRGALSYLGRAIQWSSSFIVGGSPPGPGGLCKYYLAGTGHKPGQILTRFLVEAQHASRPQHPIPDLTYDFDYTNDSTPTAWAASAATDQIVGYTGDQMLAAVGLLMSTGQLDVTIGADLDLHAWNAYGRDLTGSFGSGTVRFEKGVNIVGELRRQLNESQVGTTELVQGATSAGVDVFTAVDLPTAADHSVHEVFQKASAATVPALQALGLADLANRLLRSDAIGLQIATGNSPTTGLYLPGPAGTTNGHFWIGDSVTVHTGTSEEDFNEVTSRIVAVVVWESEADDLLCSVELGTTLGNVGFGGSTGGLIPGGGTGGSGGGSGGGGTSGGGAPTGPAAGDLAGSYPGPHVVALNGIPVTGAPSGAGDEIIATSTIAAHWATPAGGGVTVKEIDGSPSVVATEIDVPNGSLSVAGTVATLHYDVDTVKAHGSMGATETFDQADGNWHTATFNAACTFSLAAPASGGAILMFELAQDGTGGWAMTLPASVVNKTALQAAQITTLSTTSFLLLWTRDGGTTWYGAWQSSGASFAVPSIAYGTPAAGAATTAVRSDATIARPTEADLSLSAVTTGNVSTTKHGFTPVLPNDATKYLDGTGAYSVPPGSGSTIHEVVMQTGTSSPPVPIWATGGADWVYSS